MKTLLLFCTFCAIETFVITDEVFSKPPLLKDLYIKKDKDILKRALNGPKLVNKPISKLKNYEGLPTKYPNNLGEYTVFPSHAKKAIDVPSSLYFPDTHAHHDEPKLRVKKVLPDFWNVNNRKKRSPENPIDNTEKDDEAKMVKEATNVPTATDSLNKGANEPDQVKSNPEVGTDKEALKSSDVMMPSAQKNSSKDPENLVPILKIGEDKDGNKKEKVAIEASEAKNASYKNEAPNSESNKKVDAKQNIEQKTNSAAGTEKEAIITGNAMKLLPKTDYESSKNDDVNQGNKVTKNSEGKENVKSLKLKNNSNLTTVSKLSYSKHEGTPRNINTKKTENVGRRLIAARDAMIENYPYAVSIQKDGEHWCAGALLNQRLVITTANCVWKSHHISHMKIRAGSRHVEHGGQVATIAEVLKHPWWSIRKSPDFDIALLLTKSYIKFSHSCHALDLPNRAMMPLFDDAWVTSWGAERRDGVYVKQGLTLQVYHAPLLDREKCNNVTMRFGVEVSENFICLEQAGRRAPCTRDTGAPAVSDGVLWGLASWGIRKLCGTERFPAMFSYIASEGNMDFIINGTKYLMSEERLSPFLDRYPFNRVRNYSSRMHHHG